MRLAILAVTVMCFAHLMPTEAISMCNIFSNNKDNELGAKCSINACCKKGFSCNILLGDKAVCEHSPRKEGESCAIMFGHCGSGLYCPLGKWKCAKMGGLGDSCDGSTGPSTCKHGMTCQTANNLNKCYDSPRKEGQPCVSSGLHYLWQACGSGLTCTGGSCVKAEKKTEGGGRRLK